MHILVCDDDAAFSAKVAEYAATYFEAHEIPVQATVCSDPEQVLAIPDLELYRIAFLDVDMPQVNGIALGGQLRHRNPDICLVYVSAYLAFALDGYKVNAYRYILKRDVAKQLPSCLEDIYASMMQAGTKTLTVHHNRENIRIPLDQIYYLESEGRVINVYGDIAREHFCTFYGKLRELPRSTKAEPGHGMGLVNVREVLDRCRCEYTLSCRDRWFRFTCAVPTRKL